MLCTWNESLPCSQDKKIISKAFWISLCSGDFRQGHTAEPLQMYSVQNCRQRLLSEITRAFVAEITYLCCHSSCTFIFYLWLSLHCLCPCSFPQNLTTKSSVFLITSISVSTCRPCSSFYFLSHPVARTTRHAGVTSSLGSSCDIKDSLGDPVLSHILEAAQLPPMAFFF